MQAGGPRAQAAITDALAPEASIPPWPIEPVAEPEASLEPDVLDTRHAAGEPEGAGT